MKLSTLVGKRIKEAPRDAQTISHIYMMRGGYVRPLSAGIYSLLPLGKRVCSKIERIIREEMDRIDGQESLMPVVMPADIWQKSGRWDTVGSELLRFKDRNNKDMVLGMTHEEAFTEIVASEIDSYKQLPAMLYQIQTKYRDEARPRAGLIRVREFTMKDAYSFHADEACLEEYYGKCHTAYERIFQRIGMENVVSIKADSGMMGGSVSHEFMAVADCGEDVLFLSPDGNYKANREIAVSGLTFEPSEEPKALTEVETPGKQKIEELCEFLNITAEQTAKVVAYSDEEGNFYLAMIRGDFEVNEAKLKKLVQRADLRFATDEEITAAGSTPGYTSPVGLDLEKVTVVVDPSVIGTANLTVGANKADFHLNNFNFERDLDTEKVITGDIATVRAGDPCPISGEPLSEERGIEVGNIFQLGTKYSDAMGATFLDQNGKRQSIVMGCYGIGVGRSMAAVLEGSSDDYGPIWPISIAPFHVHICALNANKEEIRTVTDRVYNELRDAGIEVLLDDRKEKPGFMFNDADLIGVPHRLVISPKTLKENQVEYKTRDGQVKEMLNVEAAVQYVIDAVKADLAKYC